MSEETKHYNAGIQAAAQLARSEFWRSPDAARQHDSVWMGGYEDACDHLSAEIEKLRNPSLPLPDLEWAAQWIEGSLKGETSAEVIRFAKNMAMTFRAAMITPVGSNSRAEDCKTTTME